MKAFPRVAPTAPNVLIAFEFESDLILTPNKMADKLWISSHISRIVKDNSPVVFVVSKLRNYLICHNRNYAVDPWKQTSNCRNERI